MMESEEKSETDALNENAPHQGQPGFADKHDSTLLSPGPNGVARSLSPALADELPGMPEPSTKAPQADGDYTLERTKAHRPDAYKTARKLLAAGVPSNGVAEICGMSKHTVLAIHEEMGSAEGMTFDEVGRKVFLREARRGAVLGALKCSQMLAENDPENPVPLRDAALATKILTESSELLAGLPTARTEHVGLKVDDVLGELERLQKGDGT